jgi:hypothetical protein
MLIGHLNDNFFTNRLAVATVRVHRVVVLRHVVVVVVFRPVVGVRRLEPPASSGLLLHVVVVVALHPFVVPRSTHRCSVFGDHLHHYPLPTVGLVGFARCQFLVEKRFFTSGLCETHGAGGPCGSLNTATGAGCRSRVTGAGRNSKG